MGKASDLVKNLSSSLSGSGSSNPPPAAENSPAWVNHVAMLTGGLAALAGFLTVRSTILTNEAIYESNQAILSQTQASDAWSQYEAESIKAHIVEVQMMQHSMTPEDKSQLQSMSTELRGREPDLKKTAEGKTADRDDHLHKAQFQLGEKDILGYAGMAAQLAIALASVAALVRKRGVFHAAAIIGVLAIGLTAYAFISDYITNY